VHEVVTDASRVGHGLADAPWNASRPQNLKWELPVAAATGILIAAIHHPATNRIHSISLQNQASLCSNIGVASELGAAGLAWSIGCAQHKAALRDTGLTALAAAGAAAGITEAMKIGINRQYPYAVNSKGEFWEGGKSFLSGHSAASFAVAAVVAHRYAHKRWVKWAAYAFATAVTLSRFPAKKHFPSDMLVGATIGYVTGTSLAGH
jgi:membrane-associated phospholipid phosphatase